jgi:hypothetical protein
MPNAISVVSCGVRTVKDAGSRRTTCSAGASAKLARSVSSRGMLRVLMHPSASARTGAASGSLRIERRIAPRRAPAGSRE